jgi:hypothetical protein
MVHAHALLQAGDLDQSCTVARQALDAGAKLRSARCVDYVRTFRADLNLRAAGTALAVDLADYAADNRLWIAGGSAA